MQDGHAHLPDQELTRFADRELSPRRAAAAREHLANCQECRNRLAALEEALAAFIDLREQETEARQSSSSAARDLLKVRLSEAAARNGPAKPIRLTGAVSRQFAGAFAGLILVAGVAWAGRSIALRRSNLEAVRSETAALPRRALTPGATRAVQVDALCRNEDLENDPPVDPSVEETVFREYGLPDSSKSAYALDYLIAPALGGAEDIQNLWPEPSSATPWTAQVKDQLEDHLHGLVCQGRISLETAQNEISTDWIASYKRHFHTAAPRLATPNIASTANGDDGARRPAWRMTIRLPASARS
jgi:anti-sigma factor RsiW